MKRKDFVIMLYHGVTHSTHKGIENFSRKHIAAEEFEKQMEFLVNNYQVLSLSELLDYKKDGRLPPNSLAVTFDDGFENNYRVAYPVLKRFSVPATFYLATGFIGTNRVFWVDKVEFLINESPLDKIEIESIGKEFSLKSLKEREFAVREIKKILKTASYKVNETIGELEKTCGSPASYDYDDYHTLNWNQVREMRKSGICEFGCHTVDHEILSHLSTEEKKTQIITSKSTLETELSEDINLFSYPEGQENDYDRETIKILKSAGFTSSPEATFGVNTEETDDFHLHRNMVGFTASFNECLEVLNDYSS